MKTWLSYVKQGFARKIPADEISGLGELPTDIRTNLKHIYPFVLAHWRKGVLGAGLIFVSTLLSFPQPLISRYFVDTVIGGRRRIGYVSQSTLLRSGTVIANLRYANQEATDDEVIHAAEAANIHDFIVSLPAGYDTEIGQNGVSLSEGQRQRLSIARALVKNPDILVLDEPSSALDNLTEKSIFRSLPFLVRNKTLFVVAHRLSTIEDSDRILLLNDCRLVAVGTHQSLLETNDYYRSLYGHQRADGASASHEERFA
jgi:ABC-type multidrug transport system fused ATPase/permease subunit